MSQKRIEARHLAAAGVLGAAAVMVLSMCDSGREVVAKDQNCEERPAILFDRCRGSQSPTPDLIRNCPNWEGETFSLTICTTSDGLVYPFPSVRPFVLEKEHADGEGSLP